MSKNTKVNAAILIIGNEILSGRTQDTNTSTLATWLNSIGVKVNEVRIIPDQEDIIVDTLNLLRKSNNYVFNKFILYGFILVIIFFPLTIKMLNFLENKKNLNSFYSFVNIEKSIFI